VSASDHAEAVVVVGANGFVGRRVVQSLRETQGLRPIIAARKSAPAGDIEQRICDAADAASMAAALQGASYAVNCVAGDADTMVTATRNLCAGARAAGLRRVVHLSSMAVYGPATGLVDESAPLDTRAGWWKPRVDSVARPLTRARRARAIPREMSRFRAHEGAACRLH